jgi:hypothetical protein
VLLLLMLGGAIWQCVYIRQATDALTGPLEQAVEALERHDTEKAAQAAYDFETVWQRQKLTYEALFEHKEVDIISAYSKKLPSLCTPGHTPDAMAMAQELLFYIEHVRDIDSFGWENIF